MSPTDCVWKLGPQPPMALFLKSYVAPLRGKASPEEGGLWSHLTPCLSASWQQLQGQLQGIQLPCDPVAMHFLLWGSEHLLRWEVETHPTHLSYSLPVSSHSDGTVTAPESLLPDCCSLLLSHSTPHPRSGLPSVGLIHPSFLDRLPTVIHPHQSDAVRPEE